ncbi:MAG: hypothetical protein K0B87_08695, partial [Candidatus Syntrophosphaera sp.]|nr:hypothetical protein [Candidatus Syntrophosphaera sp.]
RELIMESRVLIAAAGISYLTEQMRANFVSRYPFLATKPAAVIPNGFDEEDFQNPKPGSSREIFHLVYSGSFYDRRQPDPLWQAILGLVESGSLDPASIAVDIFGKNTVSFVLGRFAQNETIRRMVRFHKFQPHRRNLQELMRAGALLLFIPSGKNTRSVLTGKIFDYLRSGRPILAIVPPDGIAAEMVTRAGTGFVADYQDIAGIGQNLLRLYQMWRSGELETLKPDLEYVAGFSRERLAAKLAALIEEVAL